MARVGLVSGVALCACATQPSGPGILGSPSDVTTPSGSYTGYRVVTACPTDFASIGVIGTGTVAVPKVADIASIGRDLRAQLTDITSVWGAGGYGLVCEPGVGTEISLDDWRDVDTVIARVGAFLHGRDLALQVGITVESIPVADTGQ